MYMEATLKGIRMGTTTYPSLDALRANTNEAREKDMCVWNRYVNESGSLSKAINEYNKERIRLIEEEVAKRGLSWCTRCGNEALPNDLALLFTQGTYQYSHGYEGSCWGHRDFARLDRACSSCRQHAADRHGSIGGYGSEFEEREKFYAFQAEKREDGYYARMFGVFNKIEEKNTKPLTQEIPEKLLEKLAEQWGLPARLKEKEGRLLEFEEDHSMIY
jgi:hypothetical protein